MRFSSSFSLALRPLFWVFLSFVSLAAATPTTKSVLTFTEDLSFGPEKGDAYIWSASNSLLTVDSKGNMYVADPKDNRVSMYDAKGKFLKIVAKEGSGPGEFKGLLAFQIAQGDTAVGLELYGRVNTRLQFFDNKLKYIKSSLTPENPVRAEYGLISPQGDHFAVFYIQPDSATKTNKFETAIFDKDLKLVKSISTAKGPAADVSRFGQPAYWVDRIAENLTRFYQGIGIFNFDAKGIAYTANTKKYEVTRWDTSFKTADKVFTKQLKPAALTDDDKNQVINYIMEQFGEDPELADMITPSVLRQAVGKAKLPPTKNPLYGLIPMEDGSLLVVTGMDFKTRVNTADLFQKDGKYLGQVRVPDFALVRHAAGGYLPKMVFRNGLAYALATDANGENRVVRYKYKMTP